MTPAQCAAAIAVTEQVRREVWWLNRCCARRLAYALRPLLQAHWTASALAAGLITWSVPARLNDPAAYVHHELARHSLLGQLAAYGIVPPSMPDDRVDDSGHRYARMLNDRHQKHDSAWRNYQEHLRRALRRRISTLRQAVTISPPLHVPQLREQESDFLRSLTPAARDASTARGI